MTPDRSRRRPFPSPGGGQLALAAVAVAVFLPALFGACSPGYVLRAGWEELKILDRRVPIDRAVHDTAMSRDLRRKLRLVVDAREYAERELGLDAGDSYRSYASMPSDTLMLVVSAAYAYRLDWKTWWFPVVGRVPYRGFFDFGEARDLAETLREKGFDTYVRPTAAFSTLGWLPDPVLSPALRGDSVTVVETVIHEVTHTTFFPEGAVDFNESFANFVGHRGAISFFCDGLGDGPNCRRARDRWHDTRVFSRFFQATVDDFRELYARSLPDSTMEVRKRALFRKAARRYSEEVRPRLRAGRYGELDPEGLNNAWLLGRILYYRRLDDFEAVHRRRGGLREAVHSVMQATREARDGPWEALDGLLDERSGAG